MFWRTIWDKLPECIFGNFVNIENEGHFNIFENHKGDSSQKSPEPKNTLCRN